MLRSCTQVKKLIEEQEEGTLLDVGQLHFPPEGSKNSYQTIQVKSAWYCVFSHYPPKVVIPVRRAPNS